MLFIRFEATGLCQVPAGPVGLRKKSVGFRAGMDPGKVNPVGNIHELRVDLSPSNHECFPAIRFDSQLQRLLPVIGQPDFGVVNLHVPVSAHDYVKSSGQAFASNRFKGVPAHDHGHSPGGVFIELEVIGQMPGQAVVPADCTVLAHGDYTADDDIGFHGPFYTATGALIAG